MSEVSEPMAELCESQVRKSRSVFDCASHKFRQLPSLTIGAASFLLLGLSAPVLAIDKNAQSVKVGEADLTPVIRLDYTSDSNGFLTPDDETSVTGFIISPEVELVADRRLLTATLGYRGSYAFFSEDVLDYDDHTISADVRAALSSRHRVAGSFQLLKGHDGIGSQPTLEQRAEGIEQIEHLTTQLNAQYVFGATDARGNAVAGFAISQRNYTNNDAETDGEDYLLLAPYGRFSYRLSSDARVFAELRLRNVNFDNDLKDRTEIIPALGIAFSETGKTGGEAKIGFTSAQYDASGLDDTTLLSADVSLYYEPSNISRFDLKYGRALNNIDSVSVNGAVTDAVDDEVALLWTYNWSGFVTTRARLGAEFLSRECPAVGRDTITGGFEIGLKPRRWLELGAGIQVSQRNDDNCVTAADNLNDLEYERQRFNVFARATL